MIVGKASRKIGLVLTAISSTELLAECSSCITNECSLARSALAVRPLGLFYFTTLLLPLGRNQFLLPIYYLFNTSLSLNCFPFYIGLDLQAALTTRFSVTTCWHWHADPIIQILLVQQSRPIYFIPALFQEFFLCQPPLIIPRYYKRKTYFTSVSISVVYYKIQTLCNYTLEKH